MVFSKQRQDVLKAGFCSAFMYMSMIIPGLFVLHLLTPLPLFMIGFRYGIASLFYSGGLAALMISIIFKGSSAMVYGLINLIPVAFLSTQALKKSSSNHPYPVSLLLRDLTLLMVLILSLTATYLEFKGGFFKTVESYVTHFMAQIEALNLSIEQMATIKTISLYLPAITLGSSSFLLIANALLAQFFLEKKKTSQWLTPRMADIKVEPLCFYLFVGSGLGSFLGTEGSTFLMKNAFVILSIPLFFSGLAVIHLMLSKWHVKKSVFIIFYLFVALLGWPLVIVALLGLIDYLTSYRRLFYR